MTHQKGMAVISAMLLAALTTVIVGQVIWQQQVLMSEIENQQDAAQAVIIANAAIEWSRAILAEDATSSVADHSKEIWATRLPKTSAEGGFLSGQIIDQQQFININNVAEDASTQRALDRLLLGLSLNQGLSSAILDWIDSDDITNDVNGAESMFYRTQTPPYLAANQRLTERGNLIRIKGVDKKIIDQLSPFVTVLPQRTSVNINTASAEVLSMILPDTSLQDAQNIVTTRNVAFFRDLEDFKNRLPNKNININNLNLGVSSQFFLVTCIAQFGRSALKVESLLYRNRQGWPIILWKRIG